MLRWWRSKCNSFRRKLTSLVNSFKWHRVKTPRYKEAVVQYPEWHKDLSRHRAYKDLLAWVALQRDRRFDKIVSTKKEEDLKELRGEIRALEQMYRVLASYLNKEYEDE